MRFGINSPKPEITTRSPRIAVIRGDLYSDTGYAQATRALSSILRPQCDQLFGLSIHDHASRRTNHFEFPIIRARDLSDLAYFDHAAVINICLPDEFLHNAHTFNIGYFFWETERLPLEKFWRVHMALMDRLWAPSRWQSRLIESALNINHVPVVPWPQKNQKQPFGSPFDILAYLRCHAAMTPLELHNFLIRSSPPGSRDFEKTQEENQFLSGIDHRFDPNSSPSLPEIFDSEGDVYLAVQTDAPRKGLPLLLAAWLSFRKYPEAHNAKLLIKLSSVDVRADLFRTHFHASLALRRATQRISVDIPNVWFVYDRLDTDQLSALISVSDAYVSATMGEGFGGPLAEALIHEIPVIAPAHTSCADILGDTYPLAVRSDAHILALWNNIRIYSPSSVWHIVDDVSFVDCLRRFARMSAGERHELACDAKQALLSRAGIQSVKNILTAELNFVYEGEVARRRKLHEGDFVSV
jgi:glycosyltransferase involved in cell wall biosynthesis